MASEEDGGDEADLTIPPNPYDKVQRADKPRTLKWCLWHLLASDFPQGAQIRQLIAEGSRLFDLYPSLKTNANPSGQVSAEFSSLKKAKGPHYFIKNYGGQEGAWAADMAGARAAGAGQQQKQKKQQKKVRASKAGSKATSPESSTQPQPPKRRGSGSGGGGRCGGNASGGPLLPLPAPGNNSTASAWEGASCAQLSDRLLNGRVSVWCQDEGRFFEGTILETIAEDQLLLLKVCYEDDKTEEWMRPTDFKVSGPPNITMVVVNEYCVFVLDEQTQRYVPDPCQGEDPVPLPPAGVSPAATPAALPPTAVAKALALAAPAAGADEAPKGGSDVASPAGGGGAAELLEQTAGAAAMSTAGTKQKQKQAATVAPARTATSSGSRGGSSGGRPHKGSSGDMRWWQAVVISPRETSQQQTSEERSVQAEQQQQLQQRQASEERSAKAEPQQALQAHSDQTKLLPQKQQASVEKAEQQQVQHAASPPVQQQAPPSSQPPPAPLLQPAPEQAPGQPPPEEVAEKQQQPAEKQQQQGRQAGEQGRAGYLTPLQQCEEPPKQQPPPQQLQEAQPPKQQEERPPPLPEQQQEAPPPPSKQHHQHQPAQEPSVPAARPATGELPKEVTAAFPKPDHAQQQQQQQQQVSPSKPGIASPTKGQRPAAIQPDTISPKKQQQRPAAGKPQPISLHQQAQAQHGGKKRRWEAATAAGDEEEDEDEEDQDQPLQQRKRQAAQPHKKQAEQPGKHPTAARAASATTAVTAAAALAGATKPVFSIPKRAPAVKQQQKAATVAAAGKQAKQATAPAPFRIPKAAPAAVAPAAAERPGSVVGFKRSRSSVDVSADPVQLEKQLRRLEPAAGGAAQQQQAAERRPPPAREPLCQILLRDCTSTLARPEGQETRWAAPAASAALPTPSKGSSAAAAAAAAQVHRHALQQRLASAGGWGGAKLLPAACGQGDAGGTAAAVHAAQHLPECIYHGRIFISKRETLSACMERGVFISNNKLDVEGLQPGMLALMHSLDEKVVYGCFSVVEAGICLNPSFPATGFDFHVRVQPMRLFQPVPAHQLDAICERKVHPKTQEKMKFFDRHLSQRQCRQIWSMLAFYSGKLQPEYDMRHRFGRAFNEGWERALKAQEENDSAAAAAAAAPAARPVPVSA